MLYSHSHIARRLSLVARWTQRARSASEGSNRADVRPRKDRNMKYLNTRGHRIAGRILALSAFAFAWPVDACGTEVVSNEGLIGWWTGDGHAQDIWADQDGTLVGGVSYAQGVCGQAFDFNGNNYVDVPVATGEPLDRGGPDDSVSIVCWVYSRATHGMHILGKRSGCGGGFTFYQLPVNYPLWEIPPYEWVHMAVTFDTVGTTCTVRIYINGVFRADDGSGPTFTRNTGSFRIGTSGGCSRFNGLVDEVLIFDRALAAEEIAILASSDCPNVGDPAGQNQPPTCDMDLAAAQVDFLEPSPGSFVVTTGETITATFTGYDPDGDDLTATLDGLPPEATLSQTSGPEPLVADVSWTPTIADLAGAPYDVKVTFADTTGATSSCGYVIEDINRHPTCDAGPNQEIECDNPAGMPVTLFGTATDPDPEDTTFTYHWDVSDIAVVLDDADSQTPAGAFPLGVTMATLTVTDGRGGVAVDDVTIIVQDETPPEVLVTTDFGALWPPKHVMRTVRIYIVATDACADPEYIFPLSVTVRSDEEDDAAGGGDGSTTGDVNGEDGFTAVVDLLVDSYSWWDPVEEHYAGTIELRAERAGDGDGRCYTIDIGALDSNGNWAYTSCCIVVPHDRRGGGGD